jgi:hypothetical protein
MVGIKLYGNNGYIRYQIPTNARSKKLKKNKLNLIDSVNFEVRVKLKIIMIKIGVKFSK